MRKVTLNQSVVLPKAIFDDKTKKPVMVEVTHNRRKQEVQAYDTELVEANAVVTVDGSTAAELITKGLAREYDAVLDEV